MKINKTESHVLRVETVLTEREVFDLVEDAVAKASGMNPKEVGFSAHSCINTTDSSTGPRREVKVTLTQDLSKLPRAIGD